MSSPGLQDTAALARAERARRRRAVMQVHLAEGFADEQALGSVAGAAGVALAVRLSLACWALRELGSEAGRGPRAEMQVSFRSL